jgi:NAD(P)-dependent dehydrogenase (short-subunit alcohol dehydrogenase family)
MDLHLTDKHVLITGGSKGIGLACAQGFLAEGAKVTLVSRDPANLSAAVAALTATYPATQVHSIAADMQIASAGEQVLNQAEQHFGPVDILVNSAGAAKRTAPDDLNPEAWHAAMQAKYFSYIHMIDPAIKRMAQRGGGAIVNVIGAGGKVASAIHMPGGAANAALMLVNAGMASAYAAKGVRVNAVNPGLTLTDRLQEGMATDARAQGITPEEAMQRANARIPMGRIAQAEEVADAVVYLASARASYISGVVLTMDGCTTPMVV